VSPLVAGLALAALVMGWPLAASLSGRLFYLRLGFRPTILIGLGLSVLKIIYARTHFHIRVHTNTALHRNDVYLAGAATFLRLPKLADTLDRLPTENTTYIHFRDLDYVDDACLEVLSNWQRQLGEKGASVVLEWEEALRLYRERNPLGQYQRADLDVSAATH